MYFTEAVRIPVCPVGTPRAVIVGAGAIGLYAASLLADRGYQTIVIEAGDSQLGNFSSESWRSVGRSHSGIRLARSRNLGGTTSLWGGQLVEFQPVDFADRAWRPRAQWPITYDEIAPWYRSTYINLGFPAKVISDADVWRDSGAERPDLGPDFEVFFSRWLGIPNFAQFFAPQIESHPKLCVLAGHTVTGFRGDGNRIHAVRAVDTRGQAHWVNGDIFLLAAGTVENVRLLLHIAQDPAWSAPWSTNPNIGLFFQDHLAGRVGAFHPANRKEFFNTFANLVHARYKFQPKIRMRNEVLASQQIYNAHAYFAFESEMSEHLVFLKQFLKAALYNRKISGICDVFRKGTGIVHFLLPLMWRYVWDHRVFVPSTAKTFLLIQAEHGRNPASRITIDNSFTDEYGLPRVVLDWRLGGDELQSFRVFALGIRDALRKAGVGELEIDPRLLSLDPEYLDTLGDIYHQAGGTNMASSAEHGVVDRDLRVFGTSNLYIGGPSVFPTTSNANVTFTALALITRLADHLSRIYSVSGPFSAAAALEEPARV